ncbi:HAD hydrolase family protein [Clostridium sp. PL3]|uniref:HAD hydrolase family protein n=1 Tax=Clostridium thailandense TaxID=2794346 RepID=A0A949TSN5_9CLOT|nr:HAD hydrolase family protein [Clostridium thailandense]MBV7274632.1 HAD hydrolase family protein [Clostridium thailandense]
MIKINIPGRYNLELKNIIFDYNGTLAVDGIISDYIKNMLIKLSDSLDVYILTADTYGTVRTQCKDLPISIKTFSEGNSTEFKKAFIEKLSCENSIAVGNGLNDVEMLKKAALSIAVIGNEGCASQAIISSHITCKNISDVFDVILKKDRVKATLRD